MPVAWCIGPMRRRPNRVRGGVTQAVRYCALDDYSALVLVDGGWWSFVEVGGQQFIGKVRASAATLQTIQADPDIVGISHNLLTESLSDLTAAQKSVVQSKLLLMRFTQAEIDAASGSDWGTKTLGQLLRFCARRAWEIRYDAPSDTVLDDGQQYLPTPPDRVGLEVA
jgi:hypothetical protein